MDRLHPVNTPVAAVSSASYALVSPGACSATSAQRDLHDRRGKLAADRARDFAIDAVADDIAFLDGRGLQRVPQVSAESRISC